MKNTTRTILLGCLIASINSQCFAQIVPYYTQSSGFKTVQTQQFVTLDTIMNALDSALMELADSVEVHVNNARALKAAINSERDVIKLMNDSLLAENNQAKKDALSREIELRSNLVDSLVEAAFQHADSAMSKTNRVTELATKADEKRKKNAEELAENLKKSEKSVKEILSEFRDLRKQVRSYFNAKAMASIEGVNDAEEVKRLRKKNQDARSDSLQKLIDLKNQRIALFNTMHGHVGWTSITAHEENTERFFDPFQQESTKFLQSNILTLSPESGNGALYSEIYHDYIGPIRVGFGGLLSNAASSTENDSSETNSVKEDQAQRVLGGGGNMVANISVPLVGFTSPRGTFMFRTMFQPKMALDLTGYETDSTNTPFHADLGFELHVNLTGSNGLLSFFGSVRPSILIGNPDFYCNLDKGNFRSISMAQVRFGMGIGNILRVSYSVNAGDKFVQETFPSQLSITVLTSAINGK